MNSESDFTKWWKGRYFTSLCSIFSLVVWLFAGVPVHGAGHQDRFSLAEVRNQILYVSTLDGTLHAVNPFTRKVLWATNLSKAPVLTVPSDVRQKMIVPDPTDGRLYMQSSDHLQELPFTIPELVIKAPCRSSDGLLYSGSKKDRWFAVNPETGHHFNLNMFESPNNVCPRPGKNDIYVSMTEYSITLIDSATNDLPWNATFVDFPSTSTKKIEDHGFHHYATHEGRLLTVAIGEATLEPWSVEFGSPVRALYTMEKEGFQKVPHSFLDDATFANLEGMSPSDRNMMAGSGWVPVTKDGEPLMPTVFFGESANGKYALPSFADTTCVPVVPRNTPLMIEEKPPVILSGDPSTTTPEESSDGGNGVSVNYPFAIFLGHHERPKASDVIVTPVAPENSTTQITSEPGHGSRPSEPGQGSRSSVERGTAGSSAQAAFSLGFEMWVGLGALGLAGIGYIVIRDWQMRAQNAAILEMLQNPGTRIRDTDSQHSNLSHASDLSNQSRAIDDFSNHSRATDELSNHAQTSGDLSNRDGTSRENRASGNNEKVAGENMSVSTSFAADLLVGSSDRSRDSSFSGISDNADMKITYDKTKILGRGCGGTVVYRGTFDGRDVAVKRLLPEYAGIADKEVDLLRMSDQHENVIRYYWTEERAEFRYLALELAAATLEDYVVFKKVYCGEGPWKVTKMGLLEQMTSGLDHLHSLGIVHRDLKPHNVLLSYPGPEGEVKALISDFGLCKKLVEGARSFSKHSGMLGTDGWIAPEMHEQDASSRVSNKIDIFALGCLFYYILSDGGHPFGEPIGRQLNIRDSKYDLGCVHRKHMSCYCPMHLLSMMIDKNPKYRPTTKEVRHHPYFWNDEKKLSFFLEVSDYVDHMEKGSCVLRSMEENSSRVVGVDWKEHICPTLRDDLRRYRTYNGDSVCHLLRAMRNKKHHYREANESLKASLGRIPDEYLVYFTSRFPELLLHCYLHMKEYADDFEPRGHRKYYPKL